MSWAPLPSVALVAAMLPGALAAGTGARLVVAGSAVALVVAGSAWFDRRSDEAASSRRATADGALAALVLVWTASVLVVLPPHRAAIPMVPVPLLLGSIAVAGSVLATGPGRGAALGAVPLFALIGRDAHSAALVVPALALLASVLAIRRMSALSRVSADAAVGLDALLADAELGADECLWAIGADLRLEALERAPTTLPATYREELPRIDWRAWVADGVARRDEPGSAFRRLRRAVLRRERFRRLELPLVIAGEELWLLLSGWPVEGARGGFRGVAVDITAARASERRLRRAAETDAVTGLPNRAVLLGALNGALDGARNGAPGGPLRAAPSAATCLVLIDLEGFKAINDEHGPAFGDALLRATAGRLLAGVREGDMVARVGPDEFAVLCAGTCDGGVELARRLVGRLGEPFALDGTSLLVGANGGIAFARDAADTTELLNDAELALKAAAGGRGSSVRVFEPAMREAARERHRLRGELRDALARGELTLHFQPVIELDGERVVACEALARWHHPERGAVPPATFIPLAEQSGLIGRLGDWALQEACREASTWTDGARLAVNVSVMQLRNPAFGRSVDAALALSGLPAHRLELELTESVLLEDADATLPMLHALRERGVTIALDDFGTAYASLSTLLAFRFDRVKIDRSFIATIDQDRTALAITRSVLTLADGLGVAITAEGVERPEQLDTLRRLGCREAQGFLFSRPVPGPEIRALLARPAGFGSFGLRRGAAD